MHHTDTVVYMIFVIFAGTAIMSTIALYTRQAMLVAYILLGVILGPFGLKVVTDSALISETGEIGILFLLFLLGLHLQPQNLWNTLREMSWITLISSLLFMAIGFSIGISFHFTLTESMLIGAAFMFSSTIIGLKLLPTTILHHQHTGELMISVLLLQDVIAIVVLLVLQAVADRAISMFAVSKVIMAIPVTMLVTFIFQRYVLTHLLLRFDKVKEYVFLLAIGWCLTIAELGHFMGISNEIGAFIAGISLASNPISFYIAESLRPIRDFFLVMFFFSIGASFNLHLLSGVLAPALLLALLCLVLKPSLFHWLFRWFGEPKHISWELGVRLAQISEFSLLIAYLAVATNLMGEKASTLIQAATIISFIISSYWVVLRYPTPIAVSDKLRRD